MNKPYFPAPDGPVECYKYDFHDDCFSADKFQRTRRDFSYLSGRCPRLPDQHGFVATEAEALYCNTFPLVYADFISDRLWLSLTLPDERQRYHVYNSPDIGWYYIPDPLVDEKKIRRIKGVPDKQTVLDRMKQLHTDHCLFRCEIEDC